MFDGEEGGKSLRMQFWGIANFLVPSGTRRGAVATRWLLLSCVTCCDRPMPCGHWPSDCRSEKAAPDTAGHPKFHLPKGTASPLANPLDVNRALFGQRGKAPFDETHSFSPSHYKVFGKALRKHTRYALLKVFGRVQRGLFSKKPSLAFSVTP